MGHVLHRGRVERLGPVASGTMKQASSASAAQGAPQSKACPFARRHLWAEQSLNREFDGVGPHSWLQELQAPLGGKGPIDMNFPSIVMPSNLPVPCTTCHVPSAFAASPF